MLIQQESILSGLPLCGGIAIGKIYLLGSAKKEIPQISIPASGVEKEIMRYRQAIKLARQDIRRLQQKLKKESIPEGAAILEAHLQIMSDPLLTTDIEDKIRSQKKNAECIFCRLIQQCSQRLNSLQDPFFRERSNDIKDVAGRIMGHLTSFREGSSLEIPEGSVVVAEELTPSLVAEASKHLAIALLSELGGSTSHAAIVARAKGIPYISGLSFERLSQYQSEDVIVDGRNGEIFLSPTEKLLKEYRKIQKELEEEKLLFDHVSALPAKTSDGHLIGLSANVDVEEELEVLHQQGGKGVGLYRSEFVFLTHDRFPTEEEQYQTYSALIKKLKGLPLVIRTFDVGGDKQMLKESSPLDGNLFFGCRATRFLLKERDVFKAQLRAILRAAFKADVSIMFPMVSSVSELRDAKSVLEEVSSELSRKKIPYNRSLKVGCMVEVPSAAIIADLLAKECDFLSIGTNDLVQYALAVDRTDEALSDSYAATHPAILRLIEMTVKAAELARIPVSVCGEVAADIKYLPLLLGLGVKDISVASRALPKLKLAIRSISLAKAEKLAKKALTLSTSREIETLLERDAVKVA